MEILLILALSSYGLYAAGDAFWRRFRARRSAQKYQEHAAAQVKLAADRRRSAAYATEQRLRQRNHLMQTALLQLELAPDFRRAASFAALAKDVPAAFRQRQFRRFRAKLISHLVARLRAGGNAAELRQSLEELVVALGLASFEADYLWQEAARQIERRVAAAPPSFASAVATLEQDHEQRIGVLRNTSNMDEDLREQLIEAEEQRFREALLALNENIDERQPR